MKQSLIKVLLAITAGSAIFIPGVHAQTMGENIALNKKVTLDPPSNYPLTKDRNPQQLTDGIYASSGAKWDEEQHTSSLWVQKGCVGWVKKKPVIITIDLGAVQPISGVIYSTAGGRAGVTWPETIYIATSDDGVAWHYAGDLVQLSQKNGTPPATGNFRYITRDLKTHGRYISLGVLEMPMVFTDEVEVLRGEDALLNQSAGKEIPPMNDFISKMLITTKAMQRQNQDIASIRALLKDAPISAQLKSTFEARLDQDAAATAGMELLPPDLKTILPLDDIHRDILAIHGEALAAHGFKPLTAWKEHRYAWIPLVNAPDKIRPVSLDFSMLKNQIRSDALLLTNASGKPMTVQLQLQNPPPQAREGWIHLDSATWTDTVNNIPVQTALLPLENQNGIYSLQIPAGITGKLWVTIDSSKVLSGDYKSTFLISNGDEKIIAPLHLNVSKIAMNRPRMSLIMWDYTNRDKLWGMTKGNRSASIVLMQSHFVDTPAAVWIFPIPKKATDFDANNNLQPAFIAQTDFSNLDQWVARWPDARNYFIMLDASHLTTFAGSPMGTPEFKAKVGSWTKAMVEHWESLGKKPSQLLICLVDETRTDKTDQVIVEWGKAIKAAAPQVRIFSDPIWRDPSQSGFPESFLIPDILCPHPDFAPEFYQKMHTEYHKELWLYTGYKHTNDPQLGFRQMAWRVFSIGGRGEGFWSFGDINVAPTSWNAYNASGLMAAPAFIDKTTVYNSLHWDAVRDGVEDFEELSMLRDAIAKTKNAALKTQAQDVLDIAVETVNDNAIQNEKYQWAEKTDPSVVDAQLAKVRAMLENIGNFSK
jgi:hypothetical protein